MQLADAVLHQVNAPLAAVEQLLYNELAQAAPSVKSIYLHVLQSGGKRVRPILTLLSSRLFSDCVDQAIHAAAAAEMIHMASLVHDDIIDSAVLRHGHPTVNTLWDNQTAVLTGDAWLARALLLLVDTNHQSVIRLMAEMLKAMCEGEINQHSTLTRFDLTEAEYLACIEQKTALFFAVCCQCGALLGGSSESDAWALRQYGRLLGLAYQMVDDLLDVESESAVLGKAVGMDLASGVITLPIIRALQDPHYGVKIQQHLSAQRYKPECKTDAINGNISAEPIDCIQRLRHLIGETDALQYTRAKARMLATTAQEWIPLRTDSVVRRQLQELTEFVVHRNS